MKSMGTVRRTPYLLSRFNGGSLGGDGVSAATVVQGDHLCSKDRSTPTAGARASPQGGADCARIPHLLHVDSGRVWAGYDVLTGPAVPILFGALSTLSTAPGCASSTIELSADAQVDQD